MSELQIQHPDININKLNNQNQAKDQTQQNITQQSQRKMKTVRLSIKSNRYAQPMFANQTPMSAQTINNPHYF